MFNEKNVADKAATVKFYIILTKCPKHKNTTGKTHINTQLIFNIKYLRPTHDKLFVAQHIP